MLGPEAEYHNPALSHCHFSQRDSVLNLIFASQPARSQHTLFGITSDDLNLAPVGRFESRAVDEICVCVLGHGPGNWICRVDVDSQHRSGTIKIRRTYAFEYIAQWQLQLLDQLPARSVKTNQGPTVFNKTGEILITSVAKPSLGLGRVSVGSRSCLF